jgi:hypothetical protein
MPILSDPRDPCCAMMHTQLTHTCVDHPDPDSCPDKVVTTSTDGAWYGVRIHDGGSAVLTIAFCPWCGSRLPGDLYR